MKHEKGFTLVEAAIAIAVVAILSGIVLPLVVNHVRDARIARARNDLQVIAGAIAHQFRDIGSRPINAPGAEDHQATPGQCTGAGTAVWVSHGDFPWTWGQNVDWAIPGHSDANTFEHLFLSPDAQAGTTHQQANWLFGLGEWRARDEFRYQGPYLGDPLVHGTDPWGRCYLILGYNAHGEQHNGPIWVVSAGASRTINQTNLQPDADGRYRSVWDYEGDSATNIAVRIQ